MAQTPDRRPGPLEEDEELRLIPNPVGPSVPGAMNYDGTSFVLRDALGNFNPRSGGSGITEGQHQALDTLVHEIDENSYDFVTRDGNNRVSNVTTWTDVGMTMKIREVQVTRNSLGRVTQLVTIQYDAVGAIKETLTETVSRSCGKTASITRVRT